MISATSIAYVVHNLAVHPEIQKKLQDEIDQNGISEVSREFKNIKNE